jgi:hypothetical protein
MADVAIWNGSSTFTPGSTAFGYYDTDTQFQTDADKVAKYITSRLGYPMMDVELGSGSIYNAFEHAVTTYGSEVFQYKIRENYLSLEGASTGSAFNNQLIDPTLSRIVNISKNYGTEAEVGGNLTKKTGLLTVSQSLQTYDLNQWAEDQGITGSVEIRKVYFEAPPAILRYFDPYAGTGTGVQSLMDAFDFGAYSPGLNFMMMPASFDALKIQAIEFNDQIRKSGYSFEVTNNQLRIFPIPKATHTIRLDYYENISKDNPIINNDKSLITNIGEVPYNTPVYTQINIPGREWIWDYTLAICKEMLAYVRGKYTNVPIPNSEVTLNQADLLVDARQERVDLLTVLRDMLDQTSRRAQLERKADETENLRRTLNDIPFPIYIGEYLIPFLIVGNLF